MRNVVAACSVAILLGGASTAALAQSAPPPRTSAAPVTTAPVPTAPVPTATAPAPAAPPADVPADPFMADPATVDPGFVTDGLADAPPEPRDRYEKLNRGIWGFNQLVDRIILKPVSTGYRTVIPRVARRGITRVFSNLGEPWSFVNNLLQAKPKRALNNLKRFVVNTTIGVGGLADHATKIGIAARPEDFGQTLAVWGVKSSAYVVLPLFGPSTVRDGVGTGVAFVADPYQIALNQSNLSVWTKRGVAALSLVNARAGLTESGADGFLQASLDPYAAARSAFRQRRAAAIANQETAPAVETDATNSNAASPMTGITAPGAGPIPDAPSATGSDTAPAPSDIPDNGNVPGAPAVPMTPDAGARNPI
ncbi:VacJ family lipoprotein [Sphingomonas montana]|uniref:MlaA family lipoprotein n=1 Tax=Sphingomonas montana TaxID=1843236 RepID=UPI00096ECBDB|nr:VacJ family lipoprotein [Sphingomonas montana]